MILGVSFFFFFRRLLVLPFLILRLVACSLVFLRGRSGPVALFLLFFSLTCFAWFDHTAKQEKASLSKKKKDTISSLYLYSENSFSVHPFSTN